MNLLKNSLKKNWLLFFCFIIIVLEFSQIIYFKRALFSENYNVSYWKDRFEHSQYTLPLSQRIIGDDGLYSYAGYRLIRGESIENTATFKPPVGLYMLGFSISIFNNPLIIEMLVGIATVVCFFFLVLELLRDKKLAIMATTLVTLEPFIFPNFTIALLDLPQLFFLILHLLFFMYSTRKNKYVFLFALLSGLSLGFFMETKLPLLLPVIVVLEGIYLLKRRYLIQSVIIAAGFAIGIFIPYLRYFALGNNLLDYLRLHKYFLSYYASGQNQLFPLSIWQSIFIGHFPDVVSGELIKIRDWWLLLPFVTLLGLFQAIRILLKKRYPPFLKELTVFSLATLIVYTFIPSYTRYLILVIPFLYIFSMSLLREHIKKPIFITLFVIIALVGFFYSSYLLLPSVDNTLADFKYNFSHQYFQDIYHQDISATSKKSYSEQQFRKIAQGTMVNATIKDVNFTEVSRSIPVLGKAGWVRCLVTYTTANLGKFSEEKTIDLINQQGQWKINWNWNILLNSFQPGNVFSLQLNSGKRGSIYDNKGQTLVQDSNSILIKINPDKIDTKREQQMLALLRDVTFQKPVHLQNAYLENPLPNAYVSVATPFVYLTLEQQAELNTYPGLELNPYISRLYSPAFDPLTIANTEYSECCTRIYSSSNYHGLSGIEKQYDNLLSGYNGGTLLMLGKNGNTIRTLVQRQAKNGKDVVLP
jgi:predicted membrane-bound dolichyl-phosphate-mannose-protein mannosyltransferase